MGREDAWEARAVCGNECVKSKQGEAKEKTFFLKEEEGYLSFITVFLLVFFFFAEHGRADIHSEI